jgi:acyl-coenzyme A synthetase/AMP-(fatty) acid ligase
LNFDLSIFDLFYSFMENRSLYIPAQSTVSNSRLFVQYLAKNKIEALYTTPSYLKLLVQTGQIEKFDLANLKLVLIAGEQLSYDLINELKDHFKNAAFYNLYGPTETNVCTAHKIDLKDIQARTNVPIGKPCYPKDVSTKKNGELLYKGKLLMKAFINEKGLQPVKNTSPYATGDIVKKLKNGSYEFVGRRDKMIKRNGFRIELNEIKAVLKSFNGVGNCEVISSMKEKLMIAAFIESDIALSELQLKTYCLTKLPSYMVPDRVIVLRKFPLNQNQKTDLARLELYL